MQVFRIYVINWPETDVQHIMMSLVFFLWLTKDVIHGSGVEMTGVKDDEFPDNINIRLTNWQTPCSLKKERHKRCHLHSRLTIKFSFPPFKQTGILTLIFLLAIDSKGEWSVNGGADGRT